MSTPHRCPVCDGRGTVPAGFYSGLPGTCTAPETCRTCGGSGIVWSYEPRAPVVPHEDYPFWQIHWTGTDPSTTLVTSEVRA